MALTKRDFRHKAVINPELSEKVQAGVNYSTFLNPKGEVGSTSENNFEGFLYQVNENVVDGNVARQYFDKDVQKAFARTFPVIPYFNFEDVYYSEASENFRSNTITTICLEIEYEYVPLSIKKANIVSPFELLKLYKFSKEETEDEGTNSIERRLDNINKHETFNLRVYKDVHVTIRTFQTEREHHEFVNHKFAQNNRLVHIQTFICDETYNDQSEFIETVTDARKITFSNCESYYGRKYKFIFRTIYSSAYHDLKELFSREHIQSVPRSSLRVNEYKLVVYTDNIFLENKVKLFSNKVRQPYNFSITVSKSGVEDAKQKIK